MSSSKPRDSSNYNDGKDRKWIAEVYVESDSYDSQQVLANIVSEFPKYAYILHDSDVDWETGELVKPHVHVLVEVPSPTTRSAISSRLGVPEHFVFRCKSVKAYKKYMVHRTPDSLGKFPYSPSSVVTNYDDFLWVVGERHEGAIMASIFSELKRGKNPYDLIQYACCDPKTYSVLRRNWAIVIGFAKASQDMRQTFKEHRVLVDMELVNTLVKKSIDERTIEK